MKYVLLIAALVASSMVHAQITRFDAKQLRAQLIAFKDQPPVSSLVLKGTAKDPKAKLFLEHFRLKVYPRLEEIRRDIFVYRALHILVDAYLHESPEERNQWAGPGGEFEQIMTKVNAWTVDAEWTEILLTWGRLAEGLSGELPDFARRLARERELENFSEDLKPTIDEADRLLKDFRIATNEAPAAGNITAYRRTSTEIRMRFKNGEISFQQAQAQIRDLVQAKGLHIVGHQAVERAGENLNQMAILRSKLARSKGLSTWAEYQLELSGQGYTPEYRGTKNQREFLRAYIAALAPLRDAFIEQRVRELGLEGERQGFRSQHVSLFTPPGRQQLQPYFPGDQVLNIWEESLLESGFDKKDLQQIVADIAPRQGKNGTSAYLSSFTEPYNGQTVVDTEALAIVRPTEHLKPGFAYILQNFGDSGVADLETLFHEGGHATDHLMRGTFDIFTSEPYGYTEVASMTTERFTQDPLFLWHKSVAKNGQRPTLEQIRTWVENDEKNDIVNLIAMAGTALYDLELWDYDYSAPGAHTFLERVKLVDEEVRRVTKELPFVESQIPMHYWNVAIPHFISGSVRNIGYTYAEIASRMMARYFSDEIEKLSGRRTWWRQPLLGPMIIKRFYEVGWKDQFPTSIEKITGRKFSREAVVKEMAELLGGDPCEKKILPSMAQ